MNSNFLRTKLIPVITIIIIMLVWKLPIDLGPFGDVIVFSLGVNLIVIAASGVEFRKNVFKSLGFNKTRRKIKNLLVLAPLVAGTLFLLYYFILIPVVGNLTGQPLNISLYDFLKGNIQDSLIMLLLIWITAAFGEEIVWRGYFMRQFVKFFGESKISLILNIIIFGFLFGYFHSYQGITGQIITGIIGMLLSVLFYKRKYDLWFNVAVHGYFDTIALVLIYNGWY